MKYLFTLVALVATTFIRAQQPSLSPVLNGYYGVKEALVVSDAKAAAAKAGDLLAAVNSVDLSSLPEKDRNTFSALKEKLAYDSRHISESTDINHQREHFGNLSINMVSLAKKVRLSQQPIYEDYCPMKKTYWLSGDAVIKNPYFGTSMPTCGKVTATIKP
jgi:hypothetical protein